MGIFGKTFVRAERILYYPGDHQLARVTAATKDILTDFGIDFIHIPEITCMGWPALFAGYKDDFERIRKKNSDLLKAHRITKVITNDPATLLVLKEQYKIAAQHIIEVLADNIEKIPKMPDSTTGYFHTSMLTKAGVNVRTAVRVLRRVGVHVKPDMIVMDACLDEDFARNNSTIANAICKKKNEGVTCDPYTAEKMRIKTVIEVLSET